ncbi:GNAT family N-acetyltransferase [Candidatus Leptofilum sp.]|uniref:GNAT family N-acetyltransferase n=1 Tax=Candidatus Leptofilum sp. TaxID=3241576 RepID=UPI003B5C7017
MFLIETERLQLCHFNVDDAEFVLTLVNDPGWIRFIGDRDIHTVAQAKAYLQDGPMASYATNGFGLYLVRRTADNVRLGMCGLVKRPSLPHVDIGFAFLAEYTGKGYAFEAATAVLNYAHSDLNLKPIVAITAPDNHRSVRLLEKLGLQFHKMVSLSEGEPQVNLFYPKDIQVKAR